jgi:hypothetical protein
VYENLFVRVQYQIIEVGHRVSELVIRATHYSDGGQETLPIRVTLYAELSISMQSDGPLVKVVLNEVGSVGRYVELTW